GSRGGRYHAALPNRPAGRTRTSVSGPGGSHVSGTDRGTVLSVVVPVWGRRHDLPRLLPVLRRALDRVEPRSEILVCGTDPRLQRAAEASGATFIQSKRTGYGETLRTGVAS